MEPAPTHFTELDAFTQLRGSGGALPRGLEQQILAMGHAAVPSLMALLDDDALAEDSAAGGWRSIHAVDLLVHLKATEAVDRMVRVLARTSWDDLLHDRILMRLPEFGAAVLEPALGAMVDGIDPDIQHSFCSALAQLGVRDERIYSKLCALFQEDVTFGAVCFGDYGDARALPLVEQAIEVYVPDHPESLGLTGLADLVEAHERLGGTLPEPLQARVAQLRAEWRVRQRSRSTPLRDGASSKVGRNDPCPCGSGKKYKKCCLPGDTP